MSESNDNLIIGELRGALSGLVTRMDDGFRGVHNRLDRLNGKVERHETLLITHDQILKSWWSTVKFAWTISIALVGATWLIADKVMK